jgi:hypothetical protein
VGTGNLPQDHHPAVLAGRGDPGNQRGDLAASPAQISRFAAYRYARTYNLRQIKRVADRHERARRAATRAASDQALQVLAASDDRESAAWDVDFPQARHRGQALWEAY